FYIYQLLNKESAGTIYEKCNALIRTPDFSVRNLIRKMNVKVICTTDDPVDSLIHHKKLKQDGFEVNIYPSFRPDKAMNVESAESFNSYLSLLENTSDISIHSFNHYLDALKNRHDYFASMGCTVSDHGLENIPDEDYTSSVINKIFDSIRTGNTLNCKEQNQFRAAMLEQLAIWDHEKGWVQQFHLGALRNNNSRMLKKLGPDTGWDSIGDFFQGRSLSAFLNKLDKKDHLAKTIIYNLNPSDNEVFASMIGNFNDGSIPGKMQFGSAWWFLDQKDGMIRQMNALSNMGLLSRFIGMLTDSRSFLSFPRHEYFRRLLCNLFGEEIEKGELPNDIEWTGKIIQDICYNNACSYFGWKQKDVLPKATITN
ncbi:MAG: glucuronate isomerase, partial [Flavisolibacter sp.]